ncbi:MAG: D-alanyl-D-alanine carboxypeptidase family protein [Dehalococcoidia bacterium]
MRTNVFLRRRGRRDLFRLAALGLGSVAIACGRIGGGDDKPDEGATSEEPATPKARGQDSESGTPAPAAAVVAGDPQCLVTKTQGLSAGYVPADLTPVPSRILAGNNVQLRTQATDAVVRLIDDASREGHSLFVLSGFRTYQEQERILKDEIAAFGKTVAEKQVAPPGNSEHQLGLAVDVTSERAPYELTEAFGTWPEGRWLADNAARFGYVLSYPLGKESVTGYIYEPWHIRYVGLPLSEEVAASGLTLTEFLPKHNLVGPCP